MQLIQKWIDANKETNYQRIISRRKRLHRVSKSFVKIIKQNNVNLSKKHVFEIGCGSGRNLYYIKKNWKNCKISGNDLVKGSCFKYARKSIRGTIDFYEKSTQDMVKEKISNVDIVIASDHLMHLDKPDVQEILNALSNNWKPKFILVKDTTVEQNKFPNKYIHDFSSLDQNYKKIYYKKIAVNIKSFISLYKRNA